MLVRSALLVLAVLTTPLLAQAPATPKAAPKAPAAAKTDAAKKQEENKVAGIAIPRAKGGFLGLEIKNGNFLLTFYDQEKKPVAVDVARATLRWPVKYQPNDERTVLNPGAANTLTSSQIVRPPHNFRVAISLFAAGNATAVENYSVEYRADAAPPAKAP